MTTETKAQHTPGEWRAEQIGTDDPGWFVSTSHCPGRIATVGKQSMKEQEGIYRLGAQEEANARLIAAAPELLALASELSQWAETRESRFSPRLLALIEQSRAAIAKATT